MLPRWSPSHAPGLDRKIYPCRASGEIYAQIDLKWKCRSSLCSRITGGTTTDRSSNTSPGAGLYVLCAAELCERLASTVALSLLVLYLNERLRFDEGRAARIASYVSVLSYVAGVLGACWLTEHLAPDAQSWGLLLLALGYWAMSSVQNTPRVLWVAAALLIAGSGLLMPNIAVLLGALYGPTDPRRVLAFRLGSQLQAPPSLALSLSLEAVTSLVDPASGCR